MAIHALKKGQVTRPRQRIHDIARYPAPIKGIDARVSLTEGAKYNCVYTYNLVPFEYGMAMRKGYREWQIEVDAGLGGGVHTIIPFDGIEEQGAGDKLFAVTNEGIWDVTIAGDAPILKYTFLDQQIQAGYGVFCHYVGDSEEDILFYADSVNGLFEYDALADTWDVGPTFTTDAPGVDAPITANIRFIMVHKNRLWFFEESATKAWYLEVRAKQGKASPFYFGAKFRHGGSLEGLFNWSVDGGGNVDDYLVAVSHAGDVLTYQGGDPEGSDWALRGTYFIGELPDGPFFGSEHGGELFLLSTYGLTSMNDLLKGVDSSLLSEEQLQNSISGKVTGILRTRLQNTINEFGWSVQTIPSEGGLLVSSPRLGTGPFIQFFYNFSTSSWGMWRDVPVTCFDSWKGSVVFGDEDNRILFMDVTSDNILLTAPVDKVNGDPIEFSILSSYQALGKGGTYSRVHMIRPDFLAKGPPSYVCVGRYDYDLNEPVLPAAPPLNPEGVWDVGLWDVEVWTSGQDENFNSLQGTWGTGRYVAISMRGQTREATRFIGWDVIYDKGGVMF